MKISIIKYDSIQYIILPSKIDGTYWIKDDDLLGNMRNAISIEGNENGWNLISNKDVYCIKDNKIQDRLLLSKGNFYVIKNSISNISFYVYCSEVVDCYKYYSINNELNQGISVGSSENCKISLKNLEPEPITIVNENNKTFLKDKSVNYATYINNIRVKEFQELHNGDVIFIMGVKIIFNKIKVNNVEEIFLGVINISNISVSLQPYNLTINNTAFEEDDEEIEYPLYKENEYFHKKPKFTSNIVPLDISIDPPPSKAETQDMPLLLSLGPMITMSLTSVVIAYSSLSNVFSGSTSWSNSIPSLVICFAMLCGVFLWPTLSRNYTKKKTKEAEKNRTEKYTQYINGKKRLIVDSNQEQKKILCNKYPDPKDCAEMITRKYTTLWERRIEDDDYLIVNLGYGNQNMSLNIRYPEEHFSLSEDNLKNSIKSMGEDYKILTNVPISFSFIDNYISGLIGEESLTSDYLKQLIIQILAFHSYDELKIIMLTDEKNENKYNFMKYLPHCFSNNKNIRFFGTNNNEYKEICYYLDKIYSDRIEKYSNYDPKKDNFKELFLVVTDNYKKIKDFDIIKKIEDNKKYYGFSLFIVDSKITNLPSQCNTFIKITDSSGELHKMDKDENAQIPFKVSVDNQIDYFLCSKILANLPIVIPNSDEGKLPDKLGFLEMYDVGRIEQLNSASRWEENNPTLNIIANVGIGKNGETISIDLHEKYHGPHGLIAGMTGSGKSEFIISFILSLAVNYSPEEVQFILIDYKGGGLTGTLENDNYRLPHLVGTITNLDKNEINRSLASIQSELKRRQEIFGKTREIIGESTIDIYKYQQMYRDHIVNEPISHLFIVCDEFAELKSQQSGFMDNLISAARIGRSLGIHLILATQKPSGVVDPQIWSNTRFRICMRVQDKSDSNEVIKCPDAAYLKNIGRFYFQVGYNEIFVLGQAAYSGEKYIPSEKVYKFLDTKINIVDNVGHIVKSYDTKNRNKVITKSNIEQISGIVEYLNNLAVSKNMTVRQLWLPKLPSNIVLESLIQKYKYQKETNGVDLVIGEYDIPGNQEQKLLTVPITKEGNVLIYGESGSGKENFIITLISSTMLYYSPYEVNYYILDFGAETLKIFNGCSLIGDVILLAEKEKINNLYKMVKASIEERKKLFYAFNGDYKTYVNKSGKQIPAIIIVINNIESYQENYESLVDELIVISRDSNKYGVYFVITANTVNGVRPKLKQNFGLLYVLQQNNDENYMLLMKNTNKVFPSKIFGRGIVTKEDVYEFQTAIIDEKENISNSIVARVNLYNTKYSVKAKAIPVVPKVLKYNSFINEKINDGEVIIGINDENLEVSKFNIKKNFISIISAFDLSYTNNFVNLLIKQLYLKNKDNLIIFNNEDYLIDESIIGNIKYVDNNYNEEFNALYSYIESIENQYITNNYNKQSINNIPRKTCVIIGINLFKNKLNDENQKLVENLFVYAKELGVIDFIFIDNSEKLKQLDFETWYRNSINNNNGIWLGTGIEDQFIIKYNKKIGEFKDQTSLDYCFVIKNGQAKCVKYINDYCD